MPQSIKYIKISFSYNLYLIIIIIRLDLFPLFFCSESPYSEHGALEEVDHDGGIETHTSEDGMFILFTTPCSGMYSSSVATRGPSNKKN